MSALGPGAQLGVLGGGQLGSMFTAVAQRMGYRVHVFDPAPDAPAGARADRFVCRPFEDLSACAAFAAAVDVVTFEQEHVPLAAAEVVARHAPLRPGLRALAVAQHRRREKELLASLDLPLAPWAGVARADQVAAARARIPGAALLKTCLAGYDGKGQRSLAPGEPLEAAWHELGGVEAVLEARVELAAECSVLVARGADGDALHFGPIANVHRDGILDHSSWPARLPPGTTRRAVAAARRVAAALDYVGVLCVEFFVARDGRLLANEIAPRPHNSGHLTIEACATSQFEQQLRAVCGLPLGPFEGRRGAAMANLLGDLWERGEPALGDACRDPGVKLHLYGKREPRRGRKMGHLTVTAPRADLALARALAARHALSATMVTRGSRGSEAEHELQGSSPREHRARRALAGAQARPDRGRRARGRRFERRRPLGNRAPR